MEWPRREVKLFSYSCARTDTKCFAQESTNWIWNQNLLKGLENDLKCPATNPLSLGYLHESCHGHSVKICKAHEPERRSSSTARNGCNFWDFLDQWAEIRRNSAAWPAWAYPVSSSMLRHESREIWVWAYIIYGLLWLKDGPPQFLLVSSDEWKGRSFISMRQGYIVNHVPVREAAHWGMHQTIFVSVFWCLKSQSTMPT